MLDGLLRLLHPVIPFVTEELWTALTGGESVVIARWPGAVADGGERWPRARPTGRRGGDRALKRLVTEVRRFRSDQGLRPRSGSRRVLAGLAGRRWPRTRPRSDRWPGCRCRRRASRRPRRWRPRA